MKRLLVLAAGLFVLFTGGTLSAQNVDYVGSILWNGVSDVKVVGNYAYCAFVNGLVILDVSNPAAPVFVSRLYCQGTGEGIDVAGGYAYLANGPSGLRIINVGNPQSPVLAGSYDTPDEARDVSSWATTPMWRTGLPVCRS